jgi:hypothetical protein
VVAAIAFPALIATEAIGGAVDLTPLHDEPGHDEPGHDDPGQ